MTAVARAFEHTVTRVHRRRLMMGGLATIAVACGPSARASAEQRRGDDRPSRDEEASAPQPPTEPEPRTTVVLVPLRQFPDDLLDAIETVLVEQLDVAVKRHAPVVLPASAYYKPRRRYRADKLLDHLHTYVPAGAPDTRILGLTTVDISTTNGKIKDWGVFGLGEMPGTTCVISTFRLRRGIKNREHFRFRVAVTALHEIGHTLGLDHCTETRCPMQDAEGGIENTDTSSGILGPACRAQLQRG